MNILRRSASPGIHVNLDRRNRGCCSVTLKIGTVVPQVLPLSPQISVCCVLQEQRTYSLGKVTFVGLFSLHLSGSP